MLYLIFGGFILTAVLGLVYLWTRFAKFTAIKKLAGNRKWLLLLLAAVPVAVMAAWCVCDAITGVISVIHLLVFWLMAELISRIVKKITGRTFTLYWQGALALSVTAAYLLTGWYFAHHVYETDYQLVTEKDLGMEKLRVVLISDSHVGATFDGNGFAEHMKTIQAVNPDLLVIAGDYVDDDTTREDMVKACEALGSLQTQYGIYYVYGNHDKGYMQYRDFTAADLAEELEKNHVTILEDESAKIADRICLIGRKDRSDPTRRTMKELTEVVDEQLYTIVLDHQPHDFAAQTGAGVDLVLCGHTHGGQMFPVGLLGEWSGANEKTYGLEVRKGTTFIVSSGISDWAIPFKTGAVAEFCVIDIKGQ